MKPAPPQAATLSAALSATQLAARLRPFVGDAPVPADLYPQLAVYLDLLLRWNARTNLTAIRDPGQIVDRHFGESLFCGLVLRPQLPRDATLLDFGSGAGFPGLPIQLLEPAWRVTLAESQGKKATFLREACRVLGLKSEVWSDRVESLPAARTFSAVTLRAVDDTQAALAAARPRVAPGGLLVLLGTSAAALPGSRTSALPGSETRQVQTLQF